MVQKKGQERTGDLEDEEIYHCHPSWRWHQAICRVSGKKFIRLWGSYEIMTELKEEEQEFRTATFLSCVGTEGQDIFEGLPFESKDEVKTWIGYCKSLKTLHWGKNETYESYVVHKRHQAAGESVEQFVCDLGELIKPCNFGSIQLEERLLKDQIVLGVKNKNLRTRTDCEQVLRDMQSNWDESTTKHGYEKWRQDWCWSC